MTSIYDPQWIRDQYEDYGDREWTRWEESPVERVKFQIHRRILEGHITSGVRVLDIGAGAGRFTQILAQFTDQIVVADISTKQLELNREHGEREGFASAVEARIECDLRDMSQHFEGNSFDAVVCYGGPLSYLLDRAAEGVRELARVAKPGAPILLSVMSLWGTIHQYFGGVLQVNPEVNREIIATGNLLPEKGAGFQRCHLFRADELRDLLTSAGLSVDLMSASNSPSTGREEILAETLAETTEANPVWGHLIEMELEACRDPGCVGLGSHIIASCRAPG